MTAYARFPFLSQSQGVTFTQLHWSILLQDIDYIIWNPSVKKRFWDSHFQDQLTGALRNAYNHIAEYCKDNFSGQSSGEMFIQETIEQKITRIKSTRYIYRRSRSLDYSSPYNPIKKRLITIEEFQDTLEQFGNLILIMNAFLIDIPPPSEEEFQFFASTKNNPVRIMEMLLQVSNLGSIESSKNLMIPLSIISLLEHIQLRSIKTLWSLYSITRKDANYNRIYSKSILSSLVYDHPGLLKSCMYLIMHWCGLCLSRRRLLKDSSPNPHESHLAIATKEIPGSLDALNLNDNAYSPTIELMTNMTNFGALGSPNSKMISPKSSSQDIKNSTTSLFMSLESPTKSTTVMTIPTLKLKTDVVKKESMAESVSKTLTAKVYRACLVVHLCMINNEKMFKDTLVEEVEYIFKPFLERIDYNSTQLYQNGHIRENWIFSILSTIVSTFQKKGNR